MGFGDVLILPLRRDVLSRSAHNNHGHTVFWNSCTMSCAAAAAKLLQLCPTLWDPIDGIPLCSPIPGILQARTLKWVAISFSNAWKWKMKVKSLSRVRLLATSWTTAYQAPPSMGFSRQEYWSGCHCLLRSHFLLTINSTVNWLCSLLYLPHCSSQGP